MASFLPDGSKKPSSRPDSKIKADQQKYLDTLPHQLSMISANIKPQPLTESDQLLHMALKSNAKDPFQVLENLMLNSIEVDADNKYIKNNFNSHHIPRINVHLSINGTGSIPVALAFDTGCSWTVCTKLVYDHIPGSQMSAIVPL